MEQQVDGPAQPRYVPRLDVSGMSKHYGTVLALDDVTLSVQPGEVMALLGQNGAGKSTLVRILSGLERPDAGETRINGANVDLGSVKKAQAAGIAVVQQEISAVRNMTVAENLGLGDFPVLMALAAERASPPSLSVVATRGTGSHRSVHHDGRSKRRRDAVDRDSASAVPRRATHRV